ncbi:hypothetical protein [Ruegeria sp.]|uniref:hypothetical protein n=1 Tax=Ruegeria sp. TaxID=1879320 RepID=UPI003C7B19CD
MLDILGTIGGNILSLPGILGLALGMMTKRLWLGAVMGGVIGVLETLVFAGWRFSQIEPLELIIAIVVGVCAGSLGTLIRRKGATV